MNQRPGNRNHKLTRRNGETSLQQYDDLATYLFGEDRTVDSICRQLMTKLENKQNNSPQHVDSKTIEHRSRDGFNASDPRNWFDVPGDGFPATTYQKYISTPRVSSETNDRASDREFDPSDPRNWFDVWEEFAGVGHPTPAPTIQSNDKSNKRAF
ncbi:hypothetical protein LEN26_009414 [Aphanomyces euteiches]|nr:hypothetical protein AeMF1_013982 [Aphanomyces euteiches]KAH9126134.1 hypothetical protein LEN26_009414 [Aphanomyces euteiches]KAH9185746.1 hypothetical protein AeNC1_012278 [Aphanomyces euteiches]